MLESNFKTLKNIIMKNFILSLIASIFLFCFCSFSIHNPLPKGWSKKGCKSNHFEAGIDNEVKYNGSASAFLATKDSYTDGSAKLVQQINATAFAGQRVRLTGYLKSENVEGSARLFLEIIGKKYRHGGYQCHSNTNHGISGTNDWQLFSVIIDAHKKAQYINYGVSLTGKGRVWIDDISMEVVDSETPITPFETPIKEQPENTDFEL